MIQKNIGRIFRQYNIVEYKSPDDYLSIDDFYKVYAYCCLYKSIGDNQNEKKQMISPSLSYVIIIQWSF